MRCCCLTAVAVCASVFVGCRRNATGPDGPKDTAAAQGPVRIELGLRPNHTAIVVSSHGGARVDLSKAPEEAETRRTSYSVFLPCDAEAVSRLGEALPAVAQSAVDHPPPRPLGEPVYVRCQVGRTEREFVVKEGFPESNHLWEGLLRELRTVANADLAEAIVHQRNADAIAKRGDEELALKEYMRAFDSLQRWMNSRLSRVEQKGVVDGFAAERVLAAVDRYAGPGEVSADACRRAWSDLSRGLFAVRWEDRDAIVELSLTALETRDLPPRIERKVLKSLQEDASD